MSPASRGRGLKPARYRFKLVEALVARFTRAWIETRYHKATEPGSLSPASRGRGLKRI